MMPGTFPAYVARQLAWQLFLVLLTLTLFAFLVDCLELLRRAAAGARPGIADALATALLRMPAQALRLTPLALVVAAALAAHMLARRFELAAARAAGLGMRRFLLVFALTGFGTGIMALGLQAVSATGLSHLDASHDAAGTGRSLWIEERQEPGRLVVHGEISGRGPLRLSNVLVLRFDGKGRLAGRIDAATAELLDGAWALSGASLWEGSTRQIETGRHEEPTALDESAILRPVHAPQALPFWALGGEIRYLNAAGRTSVRHEIALHGWLAMPLLLAALAVTAGAGTLRLPMGTGTALAITFGVCLGFLLFIVAELASAFGTAGAIPPALAAWIPAGVASLSALSCLAFVEDG